MLVAFGVTAEWLVRRRTYAARRAHIATADIEVDVQSWFREIKASICTRWDIGLLFLVFSTLYIWLAWIVSGGETWWIVDIINGTNVFYGDDAYRFFLARSAWTDFSLYTYNFVLPAALMLDGVITTLADGSLFLSRSMHGVLGAAAVCLVWDSGRRIGINRSIMTAAALVMGLTPRYVFTSLSFYGEFWVGFFACLLLWLFVYRHFMLAAVVAGFLPLMRPEGIYFLGLFWVYMVKERRFSEAIVMIMPGLAYALFLYSSLTALQDYNYWRFELRRILSKLALNKSQWEMFGTYTWLLVLPALFGFLNGSVRRLWPVLLAAPLWLFMLQVLVVSGMATFEERYTYCLIPALSILWAAFLAWAWPKIALVIQSGVLRAVLASMFVLMTVLAGIRQLTLIDLRIQQNGLAWVLGRVAGGEWERIFIHHSNEAMMARRHISSKITALLASDAGIDKLVIFDPFLYYKIDPRDVPKRVIVGYPSTTYMVFHLLLNGEVFIQHSHDRMYSYLRFGEPDFREGERRVLYVDLMPLEAYPYTWKWGGINYELYMFSYIDAHKPEVDLDNASMIYKNDVQNAYRQWLPSHHP